MTQLIIYPNTLGKIVIVSPAPDADIADVAAAVVPADTPHRIIDSDDLPPASDWLWSDEGPVVPAPPPALTEADFRTAIRNHVDAVAQAKNYDNAWSLGTYASSTIPEWAEQAQTFVAWRDQVWLFALAELAAIQGGERPVPTIADLVASLPEIEWPE
jgi:hypothetical protein